MSVCVGCGYCCMKTPCVRGVKQWGPCVPCGGLRWQENEQRFLCGAILDAPTDQKERLKKGLAMGVGCSSTLFNTQRNAFLSKEGKQYLMQELHWPFNS